MEVRHTLILFFLLSLQDEHFGVIGAEPSIYFTRLEGESVEVKCPFSSASARTFFCREECREKDIIIETGGVSAQDGRFRINFSFRGVSVKVSQLTKSDSGRYRCGVGSSLSSASYTDVEIIVVDAFLRAGRREPVKTTTGGNFTADCFFFTISGFNRAFFCKDECLNNLIETTDLTVQSDRYSIRYEAFAIGRSVFVSISQLTQSDSGQYSCGLKRNSLSDLKHTFEILVADDTTTTKRNPTLSTSVPSAATTPSSHEAETTERLSTTEMLLYAGLALLALLVLLALATFIFCRRKSSKSNETPMETEFTSVTETNRAFEDLKEDNQRGSLPYEHAVYAKPNEVEIDHEYSSVTRARSQNTHEDSTNITYSELNFTNPATVSLRSAPGGQSESVIYSSPREIFLRTAEDSLVLRPLETQDSGHSRS